MKKPSPVCSILLIPFLACQPVWAQNEPDREPLTLLQLKVIDRPGAAMVNSVSATGIALQVTDATGAPVPEAAVALRLPEHGASGAFADGLQTHVAYSDAAGKVKFGPIHWNELPGSVEIRLTAAKGSRHSGLLLLQDVMADKLAVAAQPTTTVVKVPLPSPPPPPQITIPAVAEPGSLPTALADVAPPTLTPPSAHTGAALPAALPRDERTTVAKIPEPKVSITNSGAGGAHGNRKMWIILGAVGAGAGVGAMMALNGKSASTPAAAPTGISIGAPVISVGH